MLDDDEYIGSFTLRHDINENLMQWGEHIEYVILPSKRGRGYAFAVINKAKNKYDGEQIENSHLEGFSEHNVWINTTK